MELPDERLEAMAQALASGHVPTDASCAAGYSYHGKDALSRAENPAMKTRVAEIKLRREAGGTADLAPVIDRLVAASDKAVALGTAAGMVAARGFLVDAARLKGLLPGAPKPSQYSKFVPSEPPMDDDAWVARFAPDLANTA